MLKKLVIVLVFCGTASYSMNKQVLAPLDSIKACIIEDATQLYAHDETSRVYFTRTSLYLECLAEIAKTISTECATLSADSANKVKIIEYFNEKDREELLNACDFEEVNLCPRDLFYRLLSNIPLNRISQEEEFPPRYQVKLNGIDTVLQICKSTKLPNDPRKNQKENYERKKQSGYELKSSVDFENNHSNHHRQAKEDLDTLTCQILTKYCEQKKYPKPSRELQMILDKLPTFYNGQLKNPQGESFVINTSEAYTSSKFYTLCKEQLPDEIVDQAFDSNGNLQNGWEFGGFGVLEGK